MCPFVGFIDEVYDDAGLEGFEDKEVKVVYGCAYSFHVFYCECILQVTAPVVFARKSDVVSLVAQRQGDTLVCLELEICGCCID